MGAANTTEGISDGQREPGLLLSCIDCNPVRLPNTKPPQTHFSNSSKVPNKLSRLNSTHSDSKHSAFPDPRDQHEVSVSSMHAADSTKEDSNQLSNSELVRECPSCLDLGSVCRPHTKPIQSQEHTKSKRRSTSNISSDPWFERRDSATPVAAGTCDTPPGRTVSADSSMTLPRSKSQESLASLIKPPLRSQLSFKGKLPSGWDKTQQERLQWAVAEVATRLKLRTPGIRSMQAAMAARKAGRREASGAYDHRRAAPNPHGASRGRHRRILSERGFERVLGPQGRRGNERWAAKEGEKDRRNGGKWRDHWAVARGI